MGKRYAFTKFVLVGRKRCKVWRTFFNALILDGKNVNLKGCMRSHKRVYRQFGSDKDVPSIASDKLVKINIPATFMACRTGGLRCMFHGVERTLGNQSKKRKGYKHFDKKVSGEKQCSYLDRLEALRRHKKWLKQHRITHVC